MTEQKYTKMLVLKVTEELFNTVEELARDDRRSRSSMARIILEDNVENYRQDRS